MHATRYKYVVQFKCNCDFERDEDVVGVYDVLIQIPTDCPDNTASLHFARLRENLRNSEFGLAYAIAAKDAEFLKKVGVSLNMSLTL